MTEAQVLPGERFVGAFAVARFPNERTMRLAGVGDVSPPAVEANLIARPVWPGVAVEDRSVGVGAAASAGRIEERQPGRSARRNPRGLWGDEGDDICVRVGLFTQVCSEPSRLQELKPLHPVGLAGGAVDQRSVKVLSGPRLAALVAAPAVLDRLNLAHTIGVRRPTPVQSDARGPVNQTVQDDFRARRVFTDSHV